MIGSEGSITNAPQTVLHPASDIILVKPTEEQESSITVKEVAEKYNVILVSLLDHDCSRATEPGKKDAIKEIFDLIQTGDKKYIATSSVNLENGSPRDLVGKGIISSGDHASVGIFLRSGKFIKAYPSDAGSGTNGVSIQKEFEDEHITGKSVVEQVENAIKKKMRDHNNEIMLEITANDIGGIVLFLGPETYFLYEKYAEKLAEICESTDIPIFEMSKYGFITQINIFKKIFNFGDTHIYKQTISSDCNNVGLLNKRDQKRQKGYNPDIGIYPIEIYKRLKRPDFKSED